MRLFIFVLALLYIPLAQPIKAASPEDFYYTLYSVRQAIILKDRKERLQIPPVGEVVSVGVPQGASKDGKEARAALAARLESILEPGNQEAYDLGHRQMIHLTPEKDYVTLFIPEGEEGAKIASAVQAQHRDKVQRANTLPRSIELRSGTYYHYLIPRFWLRPKNELLNDAEKLPLIFPSYKAGESLLLPTGFIYVMLDHVLDQGKSHEQALKRFDQLGLEVVRTVTTHLGTCFTVKLKQTSPIDALFSYARKLHQDELFYYAAVELQRVRD
jgi:hypothetical protein